MKRRRGFISRKQRGKQKRKARKMFKYTMARGGIRV